jgi:hypothetical protein
MQFQRASTNFSPGALTYLGYLYLIDARKEQYQNREKTIEGLSYIIEDIIMQNPHYTDFEKLLYFIPHSRSLIEKAYKKAKGNMLDGRLFDKQAYKNSVLCKQTRKKAYTVKSAIRRFTYKMSLVNTKSFLQYCQISDKDYTVFTPVLVSRIENRLKENNHNKKSVYLYQKKIIAAGFKNDLCQKSQRRHAYMKEQTAEVKKAEDAKELKKLLPVLREKLNNINEFRVRKISMQELLNILNKDGVK